MHFKTYRRLTHVQLPHIYKQLTRTITQGHTLHTYVLRIQISYTYISHTYINPKHIHTPYTYTQHIYTHVLHIEVRYTFTHLAYTFTHPYTFTHLTYLNALHIHLTLHIQIFRTYTHLTYTNALHLHPPYIYKFLTHTPT